MKRVLHDEGSRPIHIWTDDVEASALAQLKNVARMPFIHPHGVAAMPDVHYGLGATVGSVIPTEKAIIPAALGVDLNCGMLAVRLGGLNARDLPDSLSVIRAEIERAIPTGFEKHLPEQQNLPLAKLMYDEFVWLNDKHGAMLARRKDTPENIIASQLGTLGGGNHFIELCVDENGDLWIMLHSGSRGIGNIIGNYFIELAREDMRKHFINLPDIDLAYFPEGTEHFDDYVRAVGWAAGYARENRNEMLRRILTVLRRHLPPFDLVDEVINCHHNYVERENHFGRNVWLTRKGAIRAREGDLGIIPGSMGQRSYIVRGKGNPDSYHSCSHGAGRRMGRAEARRQFTVADLVKQTEGIECRKDNAVLDELPSSYKDIDTVMANQADLVDVVHTLKQVLCVKGGSDDKKNRKNLAAMVEILFPEKE